MTTLDFVRPPVDITLAGTYPAECFRFRFPDWLTVTSYAHLISLVYASLTVYYGGDDSLTLRFAARVRDGNWPVVTDTDKHLVWIDPLWTIRDPVRHVNATHVLDLMCVPARTFFFKRGLEAKLVLEPITLANSVPSVSVYGTYPLEAVTFTTEAADQFSGASQLFHTLRDRLEAFHGGQVMLRYASRIDPSFWTVMHDVTNVTAVFDPLQTLRDPVQEMRLVGTLSLARTHSHAYFYRRRTPPSSDSAVAGVNDAGRATARESD